MSERRWRFTQRHSKYPRTSDKSGSAARPQGSCLHRRAALFSLRVRGRNRDLLRVSPQRRGASASLGAPKFGGHAAKIKSLPSPPSVFFFPSSSSLLPSLAVLVTSTAHGHLLTVEVRG